MKHKSTNKTKLTWRHHLKIFYIEGNTSIGELSTYFIIHNMYYIKRCIFSAFCGRIPPQNHVYRKIWIRRLKSNPKYNSRLYPEIRSPRTIVNAKYNTYKYIRYMYNTFVRSSGYISDVMYLKMIIKINNIQKVRVFKDLLL